MAMSAKGKTSHYQWSGILHSHWLSTAGRCRFSSEEMAGVIAELLGGMDEVVEKVIAQLPQSFPEEISVSLFAGMREARDRMVRSRAD